MTNQLKSLKFNYIILVSPSLINAIVGFVIPIYLANFNDSLLGIFTVDLPLSLIVFNVITLNIGGFVLSKKFQKTFSLDALHSYAFIGILVAVALYGLNIVLNGVTVDVNIYFYSIYSIYFISLSSYYQYERRWGLYFFFAIISSLLIYFPWFLACFGYNLEVARFTCSILGGLFLCNFLYKNKLYNFNFSKNEIKDLLSYSLPLIMFSFFFGTLMNWDRVAIKNMLKNVEWIYYSKHLIILSLGNFIVNIISLLWGDISFKLLSNNISIIKRCTILSLMSIIFGICFYFINYYIFDLVILRTSVSEKYLIYITITVVLLIIRTIWQAYFQYFRKSLMTLLFILPSFLIIFFGKNYIGTDINIIFTLQILSLIVLIMFNVYYVVKKYDI